MIPRLRPEPENGTAIAGLGNDARRGFEQKHPMIWEPSPWPL